MAIDKHYYHRRIMRFSVLVAWLAFRIIFIIPVSASWGTRLEPAQIPFSGDLLCMPDAYLVEPGDCLPLGPSAYISGLAQKGIVYPFLPLNGGKIDLALGTLDYEIAKVNVPPPERPPLYATLDDAVNGSNPINYLQAGQLLYVSFKSRVDVDGKHFLLTSTGGWMRASPASYISFRGLVFDEPPNTSFGWIVESTSPKIAPDYFAPEADITLPRETAVQIFDVVQVDSLKFYMIGINQWVERRYIRQLEVVSTPPEGVNSQRWIDINLYEQTLAVYENNQLRFATLIASGVDPYFTRPGLFQIYEKKPVETMSGAFAADLSDYYYLEGVPWTMYYDQERALHGAYWRAWLGYPQSHGCVNLSVADSHWLYEWAQVDDWVYVWDPSGQTPTDPALYTPGGA